MSIPDCKAKTVVLNIYLAVILHVNNLVLYCWFKASITYCLN